MSHYLYLLYPSFYEFSDMAIHIGKIIKKLVKSKGISVTDFADKVNYSRRNLYEIFDKETIDTGLLLKISRILEENLFLRYITEKDIIEFKNAKTPAEELKDAVKDLKTEIQKLKDITGTISNIEVKKRKA